MQSPLITKVITKDANNQWCLWCCLGLAWGHGGWRPFQFNPISKADGRLLIGPRCLSVLSCLSELSIGDDGVLWPTVGWIKMPLGTEVGLGPGPIVLWGPSSPKRGTATPNFRPMSVVAKRLDLMNQDATWYGRGPNCRPSNNFM